MKLIVGPKANINYLAKIVQINQFKPHTDPEVTRLKCCVIDGFNIICGIDSQPGLYVYFPTACCLNPDFLRYANLYRKKELNNDPEQTGMFEENGRVKAIRLRGELSEGFILPAVTLENYILSVTNTSITCEAGTEFDCVEHNGKTFWINKKYIPKNTRIPGAPGSKTNNSKQPKGLDKIMKKVGEECTEVIIGAAKHSNEETIYEISDLAYHILVLMVEMGISVDDIRKELDSRHVIDHKVKQETMQ